MDGRNLVLIGFMGTGKSVAGKICGMRLGCPFVDSDAVIEARTGGTVARLFADQGEAAFRQQERAVIAELMATSPLVLSTGGGVVLDPGNVERLRAGGAVILLTATPECILKRVGDASTRPLLADASDPGARIQALLAEREPRYRRAAHHVIDTTDLTPEEVADAILVWFGSPESLEKRGSPNR